MALKLHVSEINAQHTAHYEAHIYASTIPVANVLTGTAVLTQLGPVWQKHQIASCTNSRVGKADVL